MGIIARTSWTLSKTTCLWAQPYPGTVASHEPRPGHNTSVPQFPNRPNPILTTWSVPNGPRTYKPPQEALWSPFSPYSFVLKLKQCILSPLSQHTCFSSLFFFRVQIWSKYFDSVFTWNETLPPFCTVLVVLVSLELIFEVSFSQKLGFWHYEVFRSGFRLTFREVYFSIYNLNSVVVSVPCVNCSMMYNGY